MKIRILLIFLAFFTSVAANAQSSYKVLQENKDIKVKYKWKENQDGKQELYIRFKTIVNANLNTDLRLGFYLNGVQKEEVHIADCLKRFFWSDWFRPIHIIQLDEFSNEDINSNQFSIEVFELKIEEVEKCSGSDA